MPQSGPVNPPDGWQVLIGTWGVDAVQDTAQLLASPTTVKIPSGNAAVKFVGPWTQINNYSADSPSAAGMRYQGRAFVYSDLVANNLNFSLVFYQADQTTIVTSSTLFGAGPATINRWVAGTGTVQTTTASKWCRFEITATAANAGNIWLGGVELIRLAPTFFTATNGPLTVPASSWTKIPWDTVHLHTLPLMLAEVDIGTPTIGGADTGLFLKSQGMWSFVADAQLSSAGHGAPANGTLVSMRLVDGVTGAVVFNPVVLGYHDNPSDVDFLWPFMADLEGNQSQGYPYVLEIWHNDASQRDFNIQFQGVFNR